MENVIDFFIRQENEIGNIVFDELEILVASQMSDVCGVACNQIVDRDDAMTLGQ